MAALSVSCFSHILSQTPLFVANAYFLPVACSYLRSRIAPLVTAFFFKNQVFFAKMWIFLCKSYKILKTSSLATWAIYCRRLWAVARATWAIYCHGLSKGGRRGGATCCRRLWAAAEGNLGNLLPWTSKGGEARVRCVNADSIVLVTNA